MKRTTQMCAWMKVKVKWTFFVLMIMTINLLHAQDNDSLCIDFKVVSQPPPGVTVTTADSICYEWKVTNKSSDTLRNVMLIDPAIVKITVPELLPFGQMSLSGSAISGSGSFMFTGSGCPLLTQAQIDCGFASYPGLVMADIGDGMGGTAGSYTSIDTGYVCLGVSLACKDVNISVNAKCETEITPSLLNVTTKIPLSEVRVRIEEPDGSFRATPFVNIDDVGKRIKIVVDVPACGSTVSQCWSYATIEYKLGPEIICSSDTISCAENVAMNQPIIADACGSTEFIRIATTRTDVCRIDPNFLAVDTVVYAVRDQFGNVSDTCRQIRYITKPNLDGSMVGGRIRFPGNRELDCTEARFNEDGTLSLNVVGYPTLDGTSFRDINREDCNLFAEFEQFTDLRLICNENDGITRRITGQWTIYEWKCEGGVTEIRGPLQVFNFVDNTPPVISELPGTLRFSVDDFECVASFTPPTATVTDECNNDFVTLQYRYLDSILSNEGQTVKLPPGVHRLEYIARDGCGNQQLDTIIVTVVDESVPVAICLKENVVSITDRSAFIRATDIDQNSYDPCGIDSIKIRRSGTFCNPQDTLWQDVVEFCCEDINDDVSVGLRVWSNGIWNECWVNVFVKGGAQARVTCIPDTIVVTCEYTYDVNDPSSLRQFGIIERDLNPDSIRLDPATFVRASGPLINGTTSVDCGVDIVELPPVVMIDSFCRTGYIDRTIEVTDGLGIKTVCRQRIVIQGDQDANPALFTYVPPNDTLTGMDGRTLESIARDNPPRADNNGCSMIGISNPPRDRVFKNGRGSSFCSKVERTWYLIDWCRSGAIPVDTHVQIILINDTLPPVISNLGSDRLVLPAAINIEVKDAVASDIRDLLIAFTITGNGITISDTLTNANATFVNDRATFIVPDVLPLGVYRLTWTVSDPCDNLDMRSQDIQILNRATTGEVVGQVLFANGGVMDKVQVHLTKEESNYQNDEISLTNIDGDYSFMQATKGESYYVDPHKNDDILNGVSTADIIVIQRHVLGIKPITEAKRKIAADINNDGKISSLDLVDLRKVLLGKSLTFTDNESWTFVYEGQNLDDIFSYGDEMMRRYYIPSLEDRMEIDFEGIKVGDVSGDAIGHSAGLAGGRSLESAKLAYRVTLEGQETQIQVTADQAMSLGGLQAELEWASGQRLLRVEDGLLSVGHDQYHTSDDRSSIRLSLSADEDYALKAGDHLFTLVLADQGVVDLTIDPSWMNAEVYTSKGAKSLQLKKIIDEQGKLVVLQNRPNPWSTSSIISVDIPQAGQAVLTVYDIHSRVIFRETRQVAQGTTTFTIDNNKVPESGMYFYEVEAAGQRAHHKMLRVD